MSRSGVQLAPQCLTTFDELKLGKKTKYIIYKLSDDKKSIVVEKVVQKSVDKNIVDNAEYDKFLAELPEKDCRFAIYDFEYTLKGGEGNRSKICFFTWAPDTAPVRPKMIYASSKEALRRALSGIPVEIQGCDFSEVAYETVLEKVSKGKATGVDDK